MNKYITIFLLFSLFGFTQSSYNNLSIELSSGYTGAVIPYLSSYESGFSGFNNISIAGRYMFSEKFGVRLEYVNDRFITSSDSKAGTYFNRFGAQLVYNLGKDLDLMYVTNEEFGLLTHAGVGYTLSKPVGKIFNEQIGSLVFGITPQVKLNNKIALFGDFSSVINFKQHYRFDGSLFSDNFTPTIGYHYNVSLGIMLYIGEKRYHSDWY
jgi:OOP family OmpA-OmpF porin